MCTGTWFRWIIVIVLQIIFNKYSIVYKPIRVIYIKKCTAIHIHIICVPNFFIKKYPYQFIPYSHVEGKKTNIKQKKVPLGLLENRQIA
jgi:hypothetical protein